MPPIRTEKRKLVDNPHGRERRTPGTGIQQAPTDETGMTGAPVYANSDVATTVDPTTHWCPPEIHEAIHLCREFLKGKIVYTGRTLNANTFAFILPLYQRFVESNLSFFADKFGYIPQSQSREQRDRCSPPSEIRFCRLHCACCMFTAMSTILSRHATLNAT